MAEPDYGYDVPARVGMTEAEVLTPALILDLDALEANIRTMGDFAAAHGLRHRAHGKMHKSVDVARLQQRLGGAVGVCCQKVSEAEAFVRGGITDVLVSNQVRSPVMLDRLARLPRAGARLGICVDDQANVAELQEAAARHGTRLEALVEIDCGSGRCGVSDPDAAVAIARAIDAAPNLDFGGVQAYQGAMQHIQAHAARKAAADAAHAVAKRAIDALTGAGLPPATVTGAGTGSYEFEAASGLYTELQCGSYAFMDADYGRIEAANGARLDTSRFAPALFVLASVISAVRPGRAIVDAGHKSHAIDSGMPVVHNRPDLTYEGPSDEHGTILDPERSLSVGDRLHLIPGHCDPTVNLHDWYVGLRGGRVECLWPVTARGKLM